MLRILLFFLLLRLVYAQGNTTRRDVSNCWSAWSPCTVTCKSQLSDPNDVDFAWRWRVWMPKRCPLVKPPNQYTQFKRCSASVPPCLVLENIFHPTSRTTYRLTALVLLMLISVVPSFLICSKYSTGVPIIHWERGEHDSPRSTMLDGMLISEKLENYSENCQKEESSDSNSNTVSSPGLK